MSLLRTWRWKSYLYFVTDVSVNYHFNMCDAKKSFTKKKKTNCSLWFEYLLTWILKIFSRELPEPDQVIKNLTKHKYIQTQSSFSLFFKKGYLNFKNSWFSFFVKILSGLYRQKSNLCNLHNFVGIKFSTHCLLSVSDFATRLNVFGIIL